jgi:hypothetical protein
MPEPGWHGTGSVQEANPTRQQNARAAFDKAYDYAVKAHEHLWIVTLAHHATENTLDAIDGTSGEMPLLDVDTLAFPPGVGCYVCEESYTRQLRRRRCKGEPK